MIIKKSVPGFIYKNIPVLVNYNTEGFITVIFAFKKKNLLTVNGFSINNIPCTLITVYDKSVRFRSNFLIIIFLFCNFRSMLFKEVDYAIFIVKSVYIIGLVDVAVSIILIISRMCINGIFPAVSVNIVKKSFSALGCIFTTCFLLVRFENIFLIKGVFDKFAIALIPVNVEIYPSKAVIVRVMYQIIGINAVNNGIFSLCRNIFLKHFFFGSTFLINNRPFFKLRIGIGIINAVKLCVIDCSFNSRKGGTFTFIIKINCHLLACFNVIFGNVIIHIRLIGNNAVKGVFFNPCFSGMKELIFEVKEHTAHFSEALKACGFPCGSVADIYKTVCIRKTLISLFIKLIYKIHILNIINNSADKGSVFIACNGQSCLVTVNSSAEFCNSRTRKNICNLQCGFRIGVYVSSVLSRQISVLNITDNFCIIPVLLCKGFYNSKRSVSISITDGNGIFVSDSCGIHNMLRIKSVHYSLNILCGKIDK